jgi:cyclopropane fatty-acyl-phospholipid synthase-like methyltransferase
VNEAFQIVRSGYDGIGGRYREWSHDSPVRLNWARRLLDEVTPHSLVVDLGCGPGEPATRLLAQHHRVIGVDASYVQLQLAQQAAPTALLVQADMTRLSLRPGSVDAVASFYALGHIPAKRHASLLSAVAGWLRPGGLLLTSAPLSAGDEQDEDWLGVPMFFGGIGQAATRQALDGAGLRIETWEVVREDEGDGHVVEFLWLIARKPTGLTQPRPTFH